MKNVKDWKLFMTSLGIFLVSWFYKGWFVEGAIVSVCL